jgi:hypothetical protein
VNRLVDILPVCYEGVRGILTPQNRSIALGDWCAEDVQGSHALPDGAKFDKSMRSTLEESDPPRKTRVNCFHLFIVGAVDQRDEVVPDHGCASRNMIWLEPSNCQSDAGMRCVSGSLVTIRQGIFAARGKWVNPWFLAAWIDTARVEAVRVGVLERRPPRVRTTIVKPRCCAVSCVTQRVLRASNALHGPKRRPPKGTSSVGRVGPWAGALHGSPDARRNRHCWPRTSPSAMRRGGKVASEQAAPCAGGWR